MSLLQRRRDGGQCAWQRDNEQNMRRRPLSRLMHRGSRLSYLAHASTLDADPDPQLVSVGPALSIKKHFPVPGTFASRPGSPAATIASSESLDWTEAALNIDLTFVLTAAAAILLRPPSHPAAARCPPLTAVPPYHHTLAPSIWNRPSGNSWRKGSFGSTRYGHRHARY
ncbi:hypothetical protein K466DRAFT_48187 [Polyporus arcularius HHB13444]|uniref:Uncharacterized protein n=1 Tax=Polyporus arcularius HHB13444 TaxID=1314778 RepID=A0A5C3PW56_9APHY|nr:hypothetical protein K466DRAFT_48187 [Polyporus arcularius HHB13444]